jgi:hypothetical protein
MEAFAAQFRSHPSAEPEIEPEIEPEEERKALFKAPRGLSDVVGTKAHREKKRDDIMGEIRVLNAEIPRKLQDLRKAIPIAESLECCPTLLETSKEIIKGARMGDMFRTPNTSTRRRKKPLPGISEGEEEEDVEGGGASRKIKKKKRSRNKRSRRKQSRRKRSRHKRSRHHKRKGSRTNRRNR